MVPTVLVLTVLVLAVLVRRAPQVLGSLICAPLPLTALLAQTPAAPPALSPPSAPTASATFDAEYARLKEGRAYSKTVPTGAMKKRHGAFAYWLVVPAAYDPAKRWQVRFQLHGGVMRPDDSLRGDGSVRLAGDGQIYVMPSGWADAPWWSDKQVASLRAILDDIKRDYNVDENRVFLSGVSDGATGLYYVATHDTTTYAAFLPLNGYYLVLRSPELELTSAIFLNNLRNKPFFIVNGGRDPLYPTNVVEPSIGHLDRGGVRITYLPQPEAGHDTSWWPDVKEPFERFTRAHPRAPLPDTLTWEVSETRTWNRAHWLVIDALGSTPDDAKGLPDLNLSGNAPVFRNGRSGRVDLVRDGNTVTVKSRGVKAFTLLLSPDQFDFDRNVTVIVNGRTVFDSRVEKNVATLTKWAGRDNDRTMLFATELKITLP
jgi:poly(3-hydroxybutyrate) depolymerase